jgi:MFS family permease
LLTGVVGGLGGLVFATAVAPLWRPHVGAEVSAGAVALELLLPYAAMTTMATGLGLSEVAVPAAAIVDGQRDAAGWLLAVWSLGSLVGGLAAARFPSAGAPGRRLPWLLLALAGGGVLTAAAWTLGLGWLAVVLFLAGLGLAPTLAAGYGVIAARAPDAGRTRAFAMGTTFVLVGLSAGSAVGGVLSEASPTAAFAAGAAAYLVAAACWALWRQRARLTRPSSQTGSADSYTLPSEPNTR